MKERLGGGYRMCEMMLVGHYNILLGAALDLPSILPATLHRISNTFLTVIIRSILKASWRSKSFDLWPMNPQGTGSREPWLIIQLCSKYMGISLTPSEPQVTEGPRCSPRFLIMIQILSYYHTASYPSCLSKCLCREKIYIKGFYKVPCNVVITASHLFVHLAHSASQGTGTKTSAVFSD